MSIRSIYLTLILFSPQVMGFDLEQLNYGFATYLGTGIYRAGDQDVQVYQLPISFEIYNIKEHERNLTINVPVTLGFYEFELQDVIDSGLPDKVSTLSVVPGVEYIFKVNENWNFGPFVNLGVATNLENEDANYVFSAGLVSHYQFDAKPLITLANKLLYAKHGGSDFEGADDFASFETVLDYQFSSVTSKYYDFMSLYLANYRYFDNLTFLRPNKRPIKVFIQNEVGISFGLKSSTKNSVIDIARLGVGYRFGNNLSVFRILLSVPY